MGCGCKKPVTNPNAVIRASAKRPAPQPVSPGGAAYQFSEPKQVVSDGVCQRTVPDKEPFCPEIKQPAPMEVITPPRKVETLLAKGMRLATQLRDNLRRIAPFKPGWLQNLTRRGRGGLLVVYRDRDGDRALATLASIHDGHLFYRADEGTMAIDYPDRLEFWVSEDDEVEWGYPLAAEMEPVLVESEDLCGTHHRLLWRGGRQVPGHTNLGNLTVTRVKACDGTTRQDLLTPECLASGECPDKTFSLLGVVDTKAPGLEGNRAPAWYVMKGLTLPKSNVPETNTGIPARFIVDTEHCGGCVQLARAEPEILDQAAIADQSDFYLPVVQATKDTCGKITDYREVLVPLSALGIVPNS